MTRLWTGDSDRDGTRAGVLLASAAVAIVLIPFGTVWLGPRTAMVVQAAAIIAALLAVLAAGLVRQGARQRLLGAPLLAVAAVAAYAGVAVIGTISGLAHGNSLSFLTGQLVSLGLLPLGAIAAWAVGASGALRRLAIALVAAAVAGSFVHLGVWIKAALQGSFFPRLYLSNNVAISGVVMLSLALALALFVTERGRRVAVIGAAILTMLVAIVGSGTRSLWAVAPVTAGLFLLIWLVAGRGQRRRAAVVLVPAVAIMAGAWYSADAWYNADRPNLIPGRLFEAPVWRPPPDIDVVPVGDAGQQRLALRWHPPECIGRNVAVTEPFPVPGPGAYALHASMLEQGGSTESLVLVEWLTAAREHCGHVILRAYPRGAWSWREVAEIAPPRTAFARILVGCKQYGDNAWMLDDIRLHRLGPSALHAFFMQVRFLKRRLGALASIAHTGTTDDPSVVGRIAETREVLGRFAVASPAVKIFGHGLGAQFTPPDEPGVTINYIHNYYAFFLFKTGIVGTVLGLGALGVFVAFTAARARRAVDPGEAALLWAAVAAWIGYLAWSNVCPEILDFRMAPLWGFLVAATASPTRPPVSRD